jgi:hypothetical protein
MVRALRIRISDDHHIHTAFSTVGVPFLSWSVGCLEQIDIRKLNKFDRGKGVLVQSNAVKLKKVISQDCDSLFRYRAIYSHLATLTSRSFS